MRLFRSSTDSQPGTAFLRSLYLWLTLWPRSLFRIAAQCEIDLLLIKYSFPNSCLQILTPKQLSRFISTSCLGMAFPRPLQNQQIVLMWLQLSPFLHKPGIRGQFPESLDPQSIQGLTFFSFYADTEHPGTPSCFSQWDESPNPIRKQCLTIRYVLTDLHPVQRKGETAELGDFSCLHPSCQS